jgi:hypothetical protein
MALFSFTVYGLQFTVVFVVLFLTTMEVPIWVVVGFVED